VEICVALIQLVVRSVPFQTRFTMNHGRISLRSLVRLWFAPSSEVPIYRQLVTQVVLAILSGDVRPGARLRRSRFWISISLASFAVFASSTCLRQSFAHVWPTGLTLHRQITCC
jgi:hypothetical protein